MALYLVLCCLHFQTGGYGSIGYRTVFEQKEAFKNLLRTHTTAISAQMLYQAANQEGGFTPKKYFSVDRVFRNESMDKTHLCEFHQVASLKIGNCTALIAYKQNRFWFTSQG